MFSNNLQEVRMNLARLGPFKRRNIVFASDETGNHFSETIEQVGLPRFFDSTEVTVKTNEYGKIKGVEITSYFGIIPTPDNNKVEEYLIHLVPLIDSSPPDEKLELSTAIRTGNFLKFESMVKKYCDAGISQNDVNENGDTLLHLALTNNKMDIAQLLIVKGADPLIKNKSGESAIKILLKRNEGAHTEESKKILALLLYRSSKSISEKSDKFISTILSIRDELAVRNKKFSKKPESILADSITVTEHGIEFDKKIHKLAFQELIGIPEIKLLLQITIFAVLGYLELQKGKALSILVDPDKAATDKMTLGDTKDAYGVYYNRNNTIYIGGKRDTNRHVRGTLIHEINHFVANEVFNNNCKPYAKNDVVNEKRFEEICKEIERRKDKVHERLAAVFAYSISNWHCELIVRVSQLIAMANPGEEYKIVKEQCPELLKYYIEVFLPACQEHLDNLRYKHSILPSNLVLGKVAVLDHTN